MSWFGSQIWQLGSVRLGHKDLGYRLGSGLSFMLLMKDRLHKKKQQLLRYYNFKRIVWAKLLNPESYISHNAKSMFLLDASCPVNVPQSQWPLLFHIFVTAVLMGQAFCCEVSETKTRYLMFDDIIGDCSPGTLT